MIFKSIEKFNIKTILSKCNLAQNFGYITNSLLSTILDFHNAAISTDVVDSITKRPQLDNNRNT
jgi:hypothetical protein